MMSLEGAEESKGNRMEDGRAWKVSRDRGGYVHDARVWREEGRPQMT